MQTLYPRKEIYQIKNIIAASMVGGAFGALYLWNNQQKGLACICAGLGSLIALATSK